MSVLSFKVCQTQSLLSGTSLLIKTIRRGFKKKQNLKADISIAFLITVIGGMTL